MFAAALLALASANPMGTFKGRGEILGFGADATFKFKSGNRVDLTVHGKLHCPNMGYRMNRNKIELTSAKCLTDKLEEHSAYISYIKVNNANQIEARGCKTVGFFPVCLTAKANKVSRKARSMMMDEMDEDDMGEERGMLMDEMDEDDMGMERDVEMMDEMDEAGSGTGGACCYAMTMPCLKCAMGSEQAVCAAFPKLPECRKKSTGGVCCYAMTMQCLKCQLGSAKAVCKAHPELPACKARKARKAKRAAKRAAMAARGVMNRLTGRGKKGACCRAMTMECLTCSLGSEEAVCKKYPGRFAECESESSESESPESENTESESSESESSEE